MTLSGAVIIPGQIMQNLTATVKTVIGLPTITPLVAILNTAVTSPIQALGITAQSVTDSMAAGDMLGALNAVANLPAEFVDQFLNKAVLDFRLTGGGRFISGGLLTNLLIKIPKAVTAAITPPAAAAAITSLPGSAFAAGTTVALSTNTTADAPAPSVAGSLPPAVTAEPARETPSAAVKAAPETPAVESLTTAAQAPESASVGLTSEDPTEKPNPAKAVSSDIRAAVTKATAGLNAAPGSTEKSKPARSVRNSIRDAVKKATAGLSGKKAKGSSPSGDSK